MSLTNLEGKKSTLEEKINLGLCRPTLLMLVQLSAIKLIVFVKSNAMFIFKKIHFNLEKCKVLS